LNLYLDRSPEAPDKLKNRWGWPRVSLTLTFGTTSLVSAIPPSGSHGEWGLVMVVVCSSGPTAVLTLGHRVLLWEHRT